MEAQLLLWIHAHASPFLNVVFVASHFVGGSPVSFMLVVVMALWHRARGERREAIVWLAVGLYAIVLGEGLKWLAARPRPALWPQLVHPWGSSFPSGHSLSGAALLPLLAREAAHAWPRHRCAWYALAVLGMLWLGIGRLYLGVHWPSDVAVGWALGLIASLAALRHLHAHAGASE